MAKTRMIDAAGSGVQDVAATTSLRSKPHSYPDASHDEAGQNHAVKANHAVCSNQLPKAWVDVRILLTTARVNQ